MRFATTHRRRGLAWRLATTYVLIFSIVLIGLSLVVYYATALNLERTLERELSAQAEFYAAYAATIASDEAAIAALAPEIVSLFAPQAGLNLRIFAATNGVLLAATQDIGPQPSQAALEQLAYRSPGVFTQASRDLPGRSYAASSVQGGERTIAVVEVSRSTADVGRFLASLRLILLAGFTLAILTLLVTIIFTARRLTRPIDEIEQATRHIAAGDLSARVSCSSDDEIGRLAASINHMASRLERLETARSQFIGEVSHDLRTPLTAVKGMLANLVDEAGPGERPALELAERETDRLIRLVNQLLDFARWQGGRLVVDRRPLDLAALARDAVALNTAAAAHRSIALSLDIAPQLPPVVGDADRLQRAIFNLLDNALKFTPSGGWVALTVAPRGAEVEIAVADSGRGMTPEERGRAFQPYFRGEGGGAGLGLAITQAIVEAHDGHMGLESEPGVGSRVWLRLPA